MREETKILKRWFDEKVFEEGTRKCGLEQEGWLVTRDFVPAPIGHEFIENLNDPMVVPELSKFNFEINSDPLELKGNVFSKIEEHLGKIWKKCFSW